MSILLLSNGTKKLHATFATYATFVTCAHYATDASDYWHQSKQRTSKIKLVLKESNKFFTSNVNDTLPEVPMVPSQFSPVLSTLKSLRLQQILAELNRI